MDVLLINPPQHLERASDDSDTFMGAIEPLGLLYLAGALLKAGFEVAVLDALPEGSSTEEILAKAEALQPLVVGLTGVTSNGHVLFHLGKALRARLPGAKVVFGNLHASFFHEFYLKNGCADFIFHGEAEESLAKAVRMLKQGRNPLGIPGVTGMDNGRVCGNPEPQYMMDLDLLPIPARHLVPMEKYGDFQTSNNLFVSRKGEKTRFMFSSRGCIYDCTFCVCHDDRRFRVRSSRNVVDEMEELKTRYDTAHINFLDSVFVGKKERVFELCKEIKERRLNISFVIEGHVNLVSPEMLRALKEAGCYGVYFGLESGNDEVLRTVRKGFRVQRVRESIRWTREAGLKAAAYFMLGMPGETVKSMQDTVDLALSLPLDLAQFSIMVPYPGSEIYETLSQNNRFPSPENREETLALWERFSPHPAFSGKDPVYVPEGLAAEQVIAFQKRAIRSYYLRPREFFRYLRRLNRRNVFKMARAFTKIMTGKK